MSVKIIPPTQTRRICKCDGCGREAEASDGPILPFGWNRLMARDATKPIERPIYGDCGGWPTTPDENSLYEFDYCDECSERVVEHMRVCHGRKS